MSGTVKAAIIGICAGAALLVLARVAAPETPLERGPYLVRTIGGCGRCHTPRDENGNPERSNWLMGGPVQLKQSYPTPTWAAREPRIAGAPPGTDEQFITLLTTGISRTGAPPNLPMPPFRMTRPDAEAVLAYLKSLP